MSSTLLPSTTGPYSFPLAAQAVLQFLHDRLPFDLWMVTRAQGEDWIVLETEDHGYGVKSKDVFRWSDSFCSRMIEGLGPRIAPCSQDIAAYREAPIGRQVKIGAYVGVPLTFANGTLFGTLCAIDPAPQPEAILKELPLIELLANMLSGLLHHELAATEAIRRAERAQAEAETDVLTELGNRRSWDRLLAAEEARCRRYGHTACVVAIDLDGLKAVNDTRGHAAGDALITRAAKALRKAARESDVLARVGGDEFVLLGVECDLEMGERLVKRVRGNLRQAEVAASVGLAVRVPSKGLVSAWDEADIAMNREKSMKAGCRIAPEERRQLKLGSQGRGPLDTRPESLYI